MIISRWLRPCARALASMLLAGACTGCGSSPAAAAAANGSAEGDLPSLLLAPVTDTCLLADSSTLFLPDGRWERTTRTPAGDGTYLGHVTDGRLDPDAAARIFAGVAETLESIPLVAWRPSADPAPAHACGRIVLVLGAPDGTQRIGGDDAALEALRPWLDELTRSLSDQGPTTDNQ